MAAKSKAETLSQLQAYADLHDVVNTFLSGDFSTHVQACLTQIDTGDEEPEQREQRTVMMNLLNNGGAALWQSMMAAVRPIHRTLGRYAASANPATGSEAMNLAAFNDKLQADTENIEKRGLTKNSFSAGGSNTGTGRVVTIVTDANGDDLDCAHVSSLKLRCINGGQPGVTAGQEGFELTGGLNDFAWEEGGIANSGRDYKTAWGYGTYDFGRGVLIASSADNVAAMQTMSGRSSNNGIDGNGDLESAFIGSGVDKIPGFTILSGTADLTLDETTQIKGDSSLKIANNCVFYTLLKPSMVYPKTHAAFGQLLKKRISGGTLTGQITAILRSGGDPDTAASGTAHSTITVDIGALTDNAVTNSDLAVLIPKTIGDNPRIEYTVTSYTASNSSQYLVMDEVYFGRMYLIDGHRSILLVSGVTDWKTDDVFTVTVSSTEGGTTQRFINRVFGRHLVSDTAATYWSDYT